MLRDAVDGLDKVNTDLEPELLTGAQKREALELYARVEKMGAFGLTTLGAAVKDPAAVSKVAGTSMGKARKIVATGQTVAGSGELASAMRAGAISLDQATAIAPAVDTVPEAAAELVDVARSEAFHVLKDRARAIKLEAEQHEDLAQRQRDARSARTYVDDLGMGHIHLILEPHRYAPIVARGEAEAARLARADQREKEGSYEGPQPFECYLADAFAAMLSAPGTVKGRSKRPELVVVVSEGVPARGWLDVRPGEHCKIPGVGPIAPSEAKEIAREAIVNLIITDGIELKHFKRFSRSISAELQVLLELGDPPKFDGIKCVDCGNRFKSEFDHVQPHIARGPMSPENIKPRCYSCHQKKTEADRKAGKLRPPPDP